MASNLDIKKSDILAWCEDRDDCLVDKDKLKIVVAHHRSKSAGHLDGDTYHNTFVTLRKTSLLKSLYKIANEFERSVVELKDDILEWNRTQREKRHE
jgi:poly(3-hydroxyalkanoate) synthetase